MRKRGNEVKSYLMGSTGRSISVLLMFQTCVLLTENVDKTADPKLPVSCCHVMMVIQVLVTNITTKSLRGCCLAVAPLL